MENLRSLLGSANSSFLAGVAIVLLGFLILQFIFGNKKKEQVQQRVQESTNVRTAPYSEFDFFANLVILGVLFYILQHYWPEFVVIAEARRVQMARELAEKGTYLYIYLERFVDPQWFTGLFFYLLATPGIAIAFHVLGLRKVWLKASAIAGWPIVYYAVPPGFRVFDYLLWLFKLTPGPGPRTLAPPIEASPDIWEAISATVGFGVSLLMLLGLFVLIVGPLLGFFHRAINPGEWQGYSYLSALLAYLQMPLFAIDGGMLAIIYDHPDMGYLGLMGFLTCVFEFASCLPVDKEKAASVSWEYKVAIPILWLLFNLVILLILLAPLVTGADIRFVK